MRQSTSEEMKAGTLNSRVLYTGNIAWKSLQFIQDDSFKELSSESKKRLKNSIIQNEFTQPFYVWTDEKSVTHYCLDGRHRVIALTELSLEGYDIPDFLPATFIECVDKKEAARLVLIYSSMYAKVSEQGLFDFIQEYDLNYDSMKTFIDLPDFDPINFEGMFSTGPDIDPIIPQSLQEKFVVPPFSILDTRQGYWQERKKEWHKLFDSQSTREDVELIAKSGQGAAVYELRNKMREVLGREPEWDEIIEYAKKKNMHIYEGASIFDPVLTEICYKWFCPEGATILDPFAGGSVRGIVAGVLGYCYVGIDLREEQVNENKRQATKLNLGGCQWIAGDSNEVLDTHFLEDEKVSFIFSCPPYHDLEKYSDDPADLSNMTYETFVVVYQSIIAKSVQRLKDNRFACFVVGDIRDEKGFYRNFLQDTIDAFQHSGECKLYNEMILVNVAGSLPIRIGRQFEGYRKVGKMHQNVLVFYKGDPKKIKEEFPEIKVEKDLESLNYQPNIALSVID